MDRLKAKGAAAVVDFRSCARALSPTLHVRVLLLILLPLLCAGCISHRKPFVIHQISPGIVEGRRTAAPAEIAWLQAHGVRTILSLEQMPWNIWTEQHEARKLGVIYRSVPILASPLEPSEKRVTQALTVLADPSLRPIYIHCFLGEDRNTFIVGLYRIYFQDWTPQAAWAEMLRSDFHDAPRLRGLKTYFWSHTQKPAWVYQFRARAEPLPP